MKLRLGPLPKTNPVKLTVSLSAELRDKLALYSKLYSEAFREPVSPELLIPHMLDQFLAKDKAFRAALRKEARDLSDHVSVEPGQHS